MVEEENRGLIKRDSAFVQKVGSQISITTKLLGIIRTLEGRSWKSPRGNTSNTNFINTRIRGRIKIKWNYKIGSNILSNPVIDNGIIYFLASDGFLYSLKESTGEELWRTETKIKFPTVLFIENGILILPEGEQSGLGVYSSICAYDTKSKSKIWTFKDGDTRICRPILEKGKVIFTTEWSEVVCLDYVTGEVQWLMAEKKGNREIFRCSPAINNNEIILSVSDGILTSLNLDTGKLEWEFDICKYRNVYFSISEIVVKDNIVFLIIQDYEDEEGLRCSHFYTYEIASQFLDHKKYDFWPLKISVGREKVILKYAENLLYLLDIKTLELVWFFSQHKMDYSTIPSIADNLVIFCDSENKLHGFNIESRQHRMLQLKAKVINNLAIANGTIYMGCDNGVFYAYQ